jgi:hypothetical protein
MESYRYAKKNSIINGINSGEDVDPARTPYLKSE